MRLKWLIRSALALGATFASPSAVAITCDPTLLEVTPAEGYFDRLPLLASGTSVEAVPRSPQAELDEPADRVFRVARAALRRRGIEPSVLLGTMTASPPRGSQAPAGAWLVTTEAGRWWVWECGAVEDTR